MKFDISVPLLGFDNIKQVELQKIDDIFMKMQAVEDEHISFTLINPFVLREYDFEVPKNIQELLEIDKDSNLLILNILLVQTPIEDSIVNFIGPLVFNTDNKKAAQIILPESTNLGIAEKISTFLTK
ncbi:MAG: flagellar assembly protein FliW [Epsilonproteobacteria bacterium]|nr:flagellar assembly protein FliW [Campylobacterota bacterium]OIO16091.1 MAG: flagellar biosynthesis protein FliW [Helicobacteraceae bacterium CG1_02_36_14]PIP10197.1 MAG: flagellar biosynthesis protein FliW [Sulfurimonas sp. CG23_combo_of_CG06-09_8_20_14_all_36_33]PIS26482.1 MAG: flagellar biosynthesis protein FliW [Sulfurimonas sp. CG08_land_8_20_14_0_20_36_33]PIU33944.1 MAG: flagellar biosynthesis protein FliW [Sulfurimonas sp. CG07_land_8_20_14_0_80_36_56]PIV03772.1 MAG: flagellar biosynt